MNKDKIIPLSLDEVCKIINYSTDNSRRLRSEINKVVFNYKGNNQRFMMTVTTADGEEIMTINPNVVFGGNPLKRDRKVVEYFETLEKWAENRRLYNKKNIE